MHNDVTALLTVSIASYTEMHALCLFIILLLFVDMQKADMREGRRPDDLLSLIYVLCSGVLVTDTVWFIMEKTGNVSPFAAYLVNILYFMFSNSGVCLWFVFCLKRLNSRAYENKLLMFILISPCVILCVADVITPVFGGIFSIVGGVYVRGPIFAADPVIKLGYIIATTALAFASAARQKKKYLRKKSLSLATYGIPILICGVAQAVSGFDFNCVGFTIGLVLIYFNGITNSGLENIGLVSSLSEAFDAAYLVNVDTGNIRSLREDLMHESSTPGMASPKFEEHFQTVLRSRLLPEDREAVLSAFTLEKVASRLRSEHSFAIRYRTIGTFGEIQQHSASFIIASDDNGKDEFLVGIRLESQDSLVSMRSSLLAKENERLARVNESIIYAVANMVEARDENSGGHILRVRRFTEVIAAKAMEICPEYGLTMKKVELIVSASVLHDIGKIMIPDSVLLKPGKPTAEEFEIMKTHCAKGCELLGRFPMGLDDAYMGYANEICRWHHERYDGRGYPDGLAGDAIPVSAQIVSVADCYDALVSARPYKKPLSPDEATDMILRGECGTFSARLMECLSAARDDLARVAMSCGGNGTENDGNG